MSSPHAGGQRKKRRANEHYREIFEANLRYLHERAARNIESRGRIALDHLASRISKHADYPVSSASLTSYLHGTAPHYSLLPAIALAYSQEAGIDPPLTAGDLLEPQFTERAFGEVSVRYSRYACCPPAREEIILNAFRPLAERGQAANLAAHEQEWLYGLLDTQDLTIRFPGVDFNAPVGETCASTSGIERRFLELSGVGSNLEVRVAPGIGDLTSTDPTTNILRITLLAAFARDYLRCRIFGSAIPPGDCQLALSGGFHIKQLCRLMAPEDIRALSGAFPLSTMPTEVLDLEPLGMSSDVIEQPALRANTLVRGLEAKALRVQHSFVARQLPWYPVSSIDRDHLYPPGRLQDYLQGLRQQYGSAGSAMHTAAITSKIDEIGTYFADLDKQVTAAILSLGHLSPEVEDQQAKLRRGIAGNFLGRYLTTDGQLAPGELNDLVLGPPLTWFRQRVLSGKPVIVLATGLHKRDIVAAAIRAGLCNVVLTDAALAQELLAVLA